MKYFPHNRSNIAKFNSSIIQKHRDMQTTERRPGDKLSVIIVDEDQGHANTARCNLVKLEFKVMVYISPLEALRFLRDHEQDVDVLLVAVDMKEMHGFQFLDISRESHKNLQVIMMSSDLTWPTMKRCVELGARFLVKKPIDDINTVNSIWQHLDLKLTRTEKIKNLFQGIGGTALRLNISSGEALQNTGKKCGNGSKHLMWTPFLQRKFLRALELLGDAATPKKIEMIMNVNSIDRKQISAHLQKHRKRIERELHENKAGKERRKVAPSLSEPLKTCETGSNTCLYNPQSAASTDEQISHDQIESITEETHGNKVYAAMRRALQLGTTFEESQLCNDQSGGEEKKGEVDMVEDDNAEDGATFAFCDTELVSGTHDTDKIQKVVNMGDPVKSSTRDDQAGLMKLVTYSDSEDDEW